MQRFLNYSGDTHPAEIKICFEQYASYVDLHRNDFPAGALAFAEASWHYDLSDPRCPHDAWLQSMNLIENHFSESQDGKMSLELNLLGAYHDGNIVIRYSEVRYYNLSKVPVLEFPISDGDDGHGDWLIDEILLNNKLVVHYISFANGAEWEIHCSDIEYRWLPFEREL